MTVVAWWLIGCAVVGVAVALWRRFDDRPAQGALGGRGENVIEFAPRASRTGRPVPPAVPRGPRRRGDAA